MLALLFFPWFSAYTAGPTPNIWPLLLSALCAVMVWLLRRRLTVERVVAAWLWAATLSALIGLAQYFGLAHTLSPWISQTDAGQAFANLRQRNQFATLTSIGLAALIGLLALRHEDKATVPRPLESQQQQPDQQQKLRGNRLLPVPWWAYSSAFLLAFGNAASNSRTGLLQWLLIPLLTAWWCLPGRWRWLVFAVQALLAYGAAVVLLPWLLTLAIGIESSGLFGRLAQDTGCSSRRILWSNVLTLIAQKPWLGWGWGELDYAHFITLYSGPRFCEILDNAHNLPLHLAVELGIPAAVAICGALGWLAWRARPWRETDPMRQMAWAVLAVIGLHSLLEYPLWYGPFQMAAGLCVWLLWTSQPSRQRARPSNALEPTQSAGAVNDPVIKSKIKQKRPLAQYLPTLLAIVLIVTLASVAVSYHRVSQIYLAPDQRSPAYRDDTLAKIRGSLFFRHQALFAELSMTGLTRGNAAAVHAMALELLHYSPEPRVIEKLIESAVMLGRDDEALYYLVRYRAAFPADHARWASQGSAPG